jgi:phospholipid/cholesterol/gamma-HCH transport system substrate-binding protein
LTNELGKHKGDVTSFVSASNDALSAIASQAPDVSRATAELPGTLKAGTRAFTQVNALGQQLGPAFNALRPFARNLDELNASVRDLANSATPIIKNKIRPFVRAARPNIPPLNTAAKRFSRAAPKLTTLAKEINRLGNMAAYNPNGAEAPGGGDLACNEPQPPESANNCRDEGYLFWAAWLGHLGNTVFSTQDANGPFRRIYFTLSCGNIFNILAGSPLATVITPLGVVFAGAGC